MIRQIKRLANLGIYPDMDPAEKRAIGLMNRLCILSIFIFLIISPIPSIIIQQWESILYDILSSFVFILCLYFLSKRKYILAKNYIAIYGCIIVPVVNITMGPDTFAFANYIGVIIMPVLIFKRRRTIYRYYTVNLLTFIGVIYYQVHYPPLAPFSPEMIPLVQILNTFISIFIIAFFLTYFYKGLQREYEQTLFAKNQQLMDQHQQLKTAQGQLVQSEKMASLGQLTAGIAHEINNPINFVSGSIGPLKRDLEDLKALLPADSTSSDAQEILDEISLLMKNIETGAHRVQQIVTDFRSFSRLDEDSRKEIDIHEGLDATLGLLSHLTMNRIEVSKQYDDLPAVNCQPGQLNQVFLHLLTNAIEAIPNNGEIQVKTAVEEKQVSISIQDSGQGIAAAILPQIFDPFFTTKEVGDGKGLGLSIAYGIIRQHNGDILVESKLGEGSRFTVQLPA